MPSLSVFLIGLTTLSLGAKQQAYWENTGLEPVAKALFDAGWYREALAVYTRWTPSSFCRNCFETMTAWRYYRIAICHAHLNNHSAAARVCLKTLAGTDWDGYLPEFVVQLYREAGQLHDLRALLDEIEKPVIKAHPKPWLLTPADRAAILQYHPTREVRELLQLTGEQEAKPWPDGLPKPRRGSLPKTLRE